MNRETRVECPVCGRMVAFVKGAIDAAGEPIMKRHWPADARATDWCKASGDSLAVAVVKHIAGLMRRPRKGKP